MSSLVLLAVLGTAAATVIPTQPDVEPGEWCSDYNAARNYAESKGIPIVVVWGVSGCAYCNGLDNNVLSTTEFIQWRQKRQLVMLYAKNTDTTDATRTKAWVKSGKDSDTGQTVTLSDYPFAMIYWKQGGQIRAEKRFTGRSGKMPVTGGSLAQQFINSIEKYIADYSAEPPPERDAWDPVDDTRQGATALSLSQETLIHGPHYLNGADTNDWFRLSALPAGSTNVVGVTGLFTDGAADLNVRVYVGDATVPMTTMTLASLATTQKIIVPKGTGTPQDVYLLVSRRPNVAATVKYTLTARAYIPRAIGFATNAIVTAEPAKGKTATLTIPVTRIGDDAATATSVNVQFTDGTAKRGVHYDCSVSKLSWTVSGTDTQTLNVTLRGDGLWTGDQTFTVTLSSPTSGFALAPFSTLTVTLRESNAYSAAKLAFAAVQTPTLGKKTAFTAKLNPTVQEGDTVTVWLSCTGGNAALVTTDLKWTPSDWLAPTSLIWLDGMRGEKPITFTVPTKEGFQRPQTVTLSFASASGATLTSGKVSLPFTVYDTIYAAPLTAFTASNPKLPLRAANDDWFVMDGGVLRNAPLPEGGGTAVMTATLAGPGILRFAAEAGGGGTLAFTLGGKPVPIPADGLVHEYLISGGKQTVIWTVSGNGTAYAMLHGMTFEPLPSETLGSFNGWVAVTNGTETAQGLATMTVSKAGKITGKLTLPGKTFSFSAPGYDTLADGTLTVTDNLSATYKKEAYPITLSVSTNAPGMATLTSADGGGIAVTLNRNGWADKVLTPGRDAALRLALNNPTGSLSKAPSGYYTLAVPATAETASAGFAGTGYLTLTLDNKGKTKLAGKLADGTSVSMSGVLLLDDASTPYLLLFTAPKTYSGGAFFAPLSVWASGSVRLGGDALWESRNPKATAVQGDGFSFALPVRGGWYAKADKLWQMYAGRDGLTAEAADAQVYFVFNAKGTGLNAVPCGDDENPMCLKVSVKSTTGLVTGSFREPPPDGGKKDVTRKLFGVLTPALASGGDPAAASFYLIPQTTPHKHTQSDAFLLKTE